MKCSHNRMNDAVVSLEGHSLWLEKKTLVIEHSASPLTYYTFPLISIPFTWEFHIFDAFFFQVVGVIKAFSVGQIHQQTQFNLDKDKK